MNLFKVGSTQSGQETIGFLLARRWPFSLFKPIKFSFLLLSIFCSGLQVGAVFIPPALAIRRKLFWLEVFGAGFFSQFVGFQSVILLIKVGMTRFRSWKFPRQRTSL